MRSRRRPQRLGLIEHRVLVELASGVCVSVAEFARIGLNVGVLVAFLGPLGLGVSV
jgi:hypothetical protein